MASVSSITQQSKAAKPKPLVKLRPIISKTGGMAYMISGSEAIKNKSAIYFGKMLPSNIIHQMQQLPGEVFIIEKDKNTASISARIHQGSFTKDDGSYYSNR